MTIFCQACEGKMLPTGTYHIGELLYWNEKLVGVRSKKEVGEIWWCRECRRSQEVTLHADE
jgi:hypothetical protein